MGAVKPRLIEWGVAARAIADQQESGDFHLVNVRGSDALVAVGDGLGHGAGAAAAAQAALHALAECNGESTIAVMQRTHDQLRSTRGVVMSLALFRGTDNTMTWLGVGNVEGYLLRRDAHVIPGHEYLLLRPGVVGDSLPPLCASVLQIAFGDTLIFATDGIRPEFAGNVNSEGSPQQIADRILAQYGRGRDDALVLVARYVNGKGYNPAG
jgi:negative regulator of sigma-B (phosphoserine phosphatase)